MHKHISEYSRDKETRKLWHCYISLFTNPMELRVTKQFSFVKRKIPTCIRKFLSPICFCSVLPLSYARYIWIIIIMNDYYNSKNIYISLDGYKTFVKFIYSYGKTHQCSKDHCKPWILHNKTLDGSDIIIAQLHPVRLCQSSDLCLFHVNA